MISLSFETKDNQEKILDKAVNYFKEKLGLKITSQDPCCVSLESELGYVRVTLSKKDEKFEVNIESREYDYWVKKFVEEY